MPITHFGVNPEKDSSKDTLPLGSRDGDLLPLFLFAHNYASLHLLPIQHQLRNDVSWTFIFICWQHGVCGVVLTVKEMPNQESGILGTLCEGQTFCFFSLGEGFCCFSGFGDRERLLFRRWGIYKEKRSLIKSLFSRKHAHTTPKDRRQPRGRFYFERRPFSSAF